MTRRRWIADEVSGNHAALTRAHAVHLIRMLRARVGQEFDIVAGSVVRSGRVVTIAEGRVEFELGDELPAQSHIRDIILLLAIFKFDRMEWAIEKATELGVAGIVPLIVKRTDAHLASAAAKRVERWRRSALQAAEQSRRAAPPRVANPAKFGYGLNLPGAVRIVLSELEQQMQLRDAVSEQEGPGEILLAIGPEGGWAQEELDLFQGAGWISASLGSTILRAETAAIAAIAVVRAELNS